MYRPVLERQLLRRRWIYEANPADNMATRLFNRDPYFAQLFASYKSTKAIVVDGSAAVAVGGYLNTESTCESSKDLATTYDIQLFASKASLCQKHSSD